MEEELNIHKSKYKRMLEPVLTMLAHKQNLLPKEKWTVVVEKTRMSIINQPEQYLGHDLGRKKMRAIAVVNLLFEEFIREKEVRWPFIRPAKSGRRKG